MLQAKTEKQKQRIIEILGQQKTNCGFPLNFDKENDWGYEYFDDRIYFDGNITFDTMSKIVDYLRNENKQA